MHKWTKSLNRILTIDVLLFNGFSNHCLANTVEPFRAANRITGKTLYQWRFLSLDGGLVTSSSDMLVETQKASTSSRDYLMIISSYGHLALANRKILPTLRALSGHARYVVGLDTGAWLMAAAGLLDARSATIHGDVFEDFSENFTQVRAHKARFIIDGDRITCGGAMASFDLVLELIRGHFGEAMRLDVANLLLHQTNRQVSDLRAPPTRFKLVSRALALMDENIEDTITITALALKLGCTSKDLQRRFLKNLGATPGQVYRHKRLNAVRNLVENTNLPISEISVRCGYENSSSMTRAFKAQFKTTPMALRVVIGS